MGPGDRKEAGRRIGHGLLRQGDIGGSSEASNYNHCIDSGALGTDGTISLIKNYIELYGNEKMEC